MARSTGDRRGIEPHKTSFTKPTVNASAVPAAPHPRSLPAKSIHKAARVFRNFTLSRFPEGSRPENYVRPQRVKDAAATKTLQRQRLEQQLAEADVVPEINVGTAIGLPQAAVRVLLPSLDPATGTVPMTDVLAVLRTQMRSTEFYSGGVPPVVQSARQSQLLAQVQTIMQTITRGAAK